jgi:hypothetical protein
METPREYYTYAYLREDGTPYYVGKGKGKRVFSSKRSITKPKDKSRIIFLKQNLTEEEAFKHEVYMIAVLGRKDLGTGILRNKTDGGEGSSGVIRSEEWKRKRKGRKWWNDGKGNTIRSLECPGPNWVLGMSEETKRKQSEMRKGENNPMYGKSHSEEMRKNVSGKNNPSYGKKWWNDGCGNSILSVKCPGKGWVLGMSEKVGEKISKAFTGKNNPAYGKKWWNDGFGNVKFTGECPGEGWVLGRGKSKQHHRTLAEPAHDHWT